MATRHPGLFLVSTTDFFYPLVEDPYAQGRIAACNVVSDVYAMGIQDIDTVLMLLAVSSDMNAVERDIVTREMIKGFHDLCKEAGSSVTGGQTVSNPWPIIGGVASTTIREEDMVRPEGVLPGDVLVLTKPLGTQVAVNVWQWRDMSWKKNSDTEEENKKAGTTTTTTTSSPPHSLPHKNWEKIKHLLEGYYSETTVLPLISHVHAYDTAVESMTRLNKNSARAMHTHKAHGATDVTGFGILGHADNLAIHSSSATKVFIELETLPIIKGMIAIDEALNGMFKLKAGKSAETSGGLLVALPSEEAANAFIADVSASDGQPAWIVGRVRACMEGEAPGACVLPTVTIVDV